MPAGHAVWHGTFCACQCLACALAVTQECVASASKPIALVVGNEEEGLDDAVASACDRLVTIPGSGWVESLNVSNAAAILLWEFTRPRHPS